MENASKALIIAGAILISILIITLGIMIYGQAKGVINDNAMSDLEIQQFNQKFTQYEGDRVRGATVNSMLQTVLANNISADGEESRQVSVSGADIELKKADTGLPDKKASTGATYKVKCNYGNTGANKGLVTSITLEKLGT